MPCSYGSIVHKVVLLAYIGVCVCVCFVLLIAFVFSSMFLATGVMCFGIQMGRWEGFLESFV